MSHRKTLTQLGWFKVAFFAPLAFGAIVAAIIIFNDPYFSGSACLTSGCLNEAIDRLKIPITIAALIFPAVALVASQHRSAQTAAQIERTDIQIAATEAKNAFENCIKHRELFFKYLEEQEKNLGIKFTEKKSLYEVIFRGNDFNRFFYYADDMALMNEPIIINDEKSTRDFQNYFNYAYFILNQCVEFWGESKDKEERKLFYLAGNLHYYWFYLYISIVQGDNERSIFDYNGSHINGHLQSDFYLMLEIIENLEKFCLSEKCREIDTSLYRTEKIKFTEASSDLSQCLYTEKRRIRPVFDDDGNFLGYENVSLPEDVIPF